MKKPLSLKKIFLGIFLIPLSMSSLFGQDFYDLNKIQEIKLYFTQPNWNSLLVSAAASTAEPFTFCSKVVINGVTFDSVGAKYKGNSSFSATRVKNPWHIELNNIKNHDYQGYKDIKLSNIFSDPSAIREALSYDLMQPYTNLPRANYAKVWVNDVLIGLYTNVEAVTKSFCKRHFPSSNGNIFVKGTPPSLQGGTGGASSLAYLGTDSSLYYKSYEIYSDYGWKQLIHLCDTLNNKPSADIEKILDVDHNLWMLAFNILFVNLDSYTGNFTQNYYLWRDDNGRFAPIIWDLNMSFGGFPGGAGTGALDSLGMAKLSPFTHEANAAKPLISKILNNDRFRKMYIAHLRTMNNELFKSAKYRTRGETIRQLIDADFLNDPNKLTTYAQFKTNFYYGIIGGGGPGGGGAPGIVSLVENKIKYLDTLAVMKAVPPTISNVASSQNTRLNDTMWITAKVTNTITNGVLMGYRTSHEGYFQRILMFDDGLHRDGLANDGVYGVGVKMKELSMEYYIWSENFAAGIFSPERAEHEFHTAKVFLAAGDIAINEIMASNTKTAQDANSEFDDWIELYNKSAAPVNIGGWHISDDDTNLKKWKIPTGTTIPADGYLIIWADEDSSQNTATSLHANFKLSASGEAVYLSKSDTTLVDFTTFGLQKADISFARRPNGTGNFASLTPTFKANNNTATSGTEDILAETDVKIFPNPAHTEGVTIQVKSDKNMGLHIYNALGQSVLNSTISNERVIDTQNWQRGVYIVRIGNMSKKLIVN
jgi:spore coat protein CotH